MYKRKIGRLMLNKETLRNLQNAELTQVVGGVGQVVGGVGQWHRAREDVRLLTGACPCPSGLTDGDGGGNIDIGQAQYAYQQNNYGGSFNC